MNAKKNLVFIITQLLIIITGSKVYSEQFEGDTCESYKCIAVKYCKHATDRIADGIYPKLCGFEGEEPLTCCDPPEKSSRNAGSSRVSKKMCDVYRTETTFSSPYIYGGEPAKPKELPFMAHIGYGEKGEETWQCGGSLISKRYVLSAAHCTDGFNSGIASWAKLGDLDTSTDTDDAKSVIFKIVARFNHPEYNPNENYNDIALYRLDKQVIFNSDVLPICLQADPLEVTKAEVAGWGRIGFVERVSSQLLKVTVDLLDVSECSKTATLDQLPRGLDADAMICAGALSGGRDSCQGDSGGPLFSMKGKYDHHLRTQYGVTSFGYQCGLEGYPGVYTKVSYHLDWIESIVWPSKKNDDMLVWAT